MELRGYYRCICGEVYHQINLEQYDSKRDPRGTWFRLLPFYGPAGENWTSFPENDQAIRGADLCCPGCGAVYEDIVKRIEWYVDDRYYGRGLEGYRIAKSVIKRLEQVQNDRNKEKKQVQGGSDFGSLDSFFEFLPDFA